VSATDESAAEFERLVDAYYRPLFRFAMSLCGSEGTASDLVQQTFYAWAAKGDQLRDRTRAKAWLFTTLHREFLQLIRRDSRLVPLPDDHEETMGAEEPAPEPAVIENIEPADLHTALAETPEVFRVPLALFYLESFTYAEIADLLSIPIGTVMSRLSRGKQKLRKRLRTRTHQSGTPLLRFSAPKRTAHG
jgi:RNA polymerase sigma-70 factor (ECF subfamily)